MLPPEGSLVRKLWTHAVICVQCYVQLVYTSSETTVVHFSLLCPRSCGIVQGRVSAPDEEVVRVHFVP